MIPPNTTSLMIPDEQPVLANIAISATAVATAALANILKVLAVCLPRSRASCNNQMIWNSTSELS